MKTDELMAAIKGKDETARADAWMAAASAGVEAVEPLAGVMNDQDTETRRAATRALWKIVRHAGRPGASSDALALSKALVGLLATQQPPAVLRELCWMLSEIAGDEAVAPLAGLLAHEELREHARAALQRIPGAKSLAALKDALNAAPKEYKPALADSLKKRGAEVPSVKIEKLRPTKSTHVKPVGRA